MFAGSFMMRSPQELPTRTVRIQASGSPGPLPEPAPRQHPGRVLVVDDDILIREMLSETLLDAGFEVVTTRDPERARHHLQREAPARFDCVVTDYLMPGMNGIDFARWILAQDPTLKILLLTSEDDKEVVKASLRGGIYDFLEKPVCQTSLLEAVLRAVQETRKLRQSRPRRYIVDNPIPIGEGGMGAVYRAIDTELNRPVALKRLRATSGLEHSPTATLFKEATTLASLQHPNIVQVYDCGTDDEGPFIVMELLQGRGLDRFVPEGTGLDAATFVHLARQCLQGLAAAHSLGVLHRDIKPSNIMVLDLPGGAHHAKLLDFGLAKYALRPSLQTVDDAGNISGSIHTMSPEQLRQEPIGPRADLYALGCVFYFMASGRLPFSGETLVETFHNHLEHRVQHLAELRPDLPHSLTTPVMSMMAYDPVHRPATAADALAHFSA